MVTTSQLATGRGGELPRTARSFLGKTIVRIPIGFTGASIANDTGIIGNFLAAPADADTAQITNRRAAALHPDGPIALILRKISEAATVVMTDELPTSGSTATWNVYVEGEFGDTFTTGLADDHENAETLRDRILAALNDLCVHIAGLENDRLDVPITVGTGEEAHRRFALAAFGSVSSGAGTSIITPGAVSTWETYEAENGGNND